MPMFRPENVAHNQPLQTCHGRNEERRHDYTNSAADIWMRLKQLVRDVVEITGSDHRRDCPSRAASLESFRHCGRSGRCETRPTQPGHFIQYGPQGAITNGPAS